MNEASPGQRARPERPEPPRAAAARASGDDGDQGGGAASAPRPLYVTGLVGALWCIGIGLAMLTTITLLGWVAAPRTALGPGLPGVFRTAVNLWLVSHHAGFSVPQGRVGLLPLGLIVLPGALLYRSGGWMIRAAGVPSRPRIGVVHVAVALAAPYAALAGLLALAATSPTVRASAWQALVAAFVVALVSGALGAARALVAARGRRVRSGLGALLRLLPERPRSLVIGVAGATAVLLGSGAVLVGASLAVHTPQFTELYDALAPGAVGGVLLLLLQLAFLPNAIIWGMAYAIGPGFSVGAGTGVSPSGVFIDVIPTFPALAALPEPGPAPLVSLIALAAPFTAGAVGGVLTVRAMPSPMYEAAPLWGFMSGALTGAAAAVLSALAGGPLGGGRLATVGPSPWQVGLLAALEVGISAAIAAWLANWRTMRRPVPEPGEEEPPGRRTRRGRASKGGESAGRAPTRRERRREKKAAALPAPDLETGESPLPPLPEPAAAPVPEQAEKPAASSRKPSPYDADPLEFEEAEPVLAPRKPSRAGVLPAEPEPFDDLAEPERPPGPAHGTPWPAEEETWTGETWAEEDGADDEPEPAPRSVPAPREDAERTENRGGAIYVLRDDPDRD
ncbi:cell division protein PerM [Spirillospora sp. CA-255316]